MIQICCASRDYVLVCRCCGREVFPLEAWVADAFQRWKDPANGWGGEFWMKIASAQVGLVKETLVAEVGHVPDHWGLIRYGSMEATFREGRTQVIRISRTLKPPTGGSS